LLKAWIEACFPAIDSALKNAYFPVKKSQDKRRWNLMVVRAKPSAWKRGATKAQPKVKTINLKHGGNGG